MGKSVFTKILDFFYFHILTINLAIFARFQRIEHESGFRVEKMELPTNLIKKKLFRIFFMRKILPSPILLQYFCPNFANFWPFYQYIGTLF